MAPGNASSILGSGHPLLSGETKPSLDTDQSTWLSQHIVPKGEPHPLGHAATEEEFPAPLLCVVASWLWGWRSPGLDPAPATTALAQRTGFGEGEGRPSRWVRKGEKSRKTGQDCKTAAERAGR